MSKFKEYFEESLNEGKDDKLKLLNDVINKLKKENITDKERKLLIKQLDAIKKFFL